MNHSIGSIPPVESVVTIDGKVNSACVRPVLHEESLALSDFRPEGEHLIYREFGHHILIYIRDIDFVQLLPRLEVRLPPPYEGNPMWHGEYRVVRGRAACDYPYQRRKMRSLHINATRLVQSTRISLSAMLGPRDDPGDWPPQLALEIWFVIPDIEIDRFVRGTEANQLFRKLIVNRNGQ